MLINHGKTLGKNLLPTHAAARPHNPASIRETAMHGTGISADIGKAISRMFGAMGMLPVLIALYIGFYFLTGYFAEDGISNFATTANTMNILRQTSINLVLATGMTFALLTGGIDLSVGSVLAVSAVLGMI